MPTGASDGTARLYTDGVFPTADGRARFAAVTYVPVAEPTDARYPLRLNTGRLRDQWHGMSRTGTVAQLFAHTGEPQLLMHSLDMLRRDLADGDLARIATAARRDHRAGGGERRTEARAGLPADALGKRRVWAATACTASMR